MSVVAPAIKSRRFGPGPRAARVTRWLRSAPGGAVLPAPRRVRRKATARSVDLRQLIGLRPLASDLGPMLLQRRVLAAQSGAYQSRHRGRGIDFHEVRVYQPGDDIRQMDWRVTARTGRAHTKLYHEERERPVLLAVDQGASMRFGTRVAFKSVLAAQAAALIAWGAAARGDRVGGVVFAGAAHAELRPQGRIHGVLRLLRALATAQGAHPSADAGTHVNGLHSALIRLARITHPGSLLFLLSDFRGFGPEAERLFAQLARHNEVVAVFLYDPLEAEPPPPGQYRVSDGTHFQTLEAGGKAFERRYRQRFEARRERLARCCRRHCVQLVSLATDAQLLPALRAALAARPSGAAATG